MYGSGGKKTLFGGNIPAPNNKPASELSAEDHSLLVSICGETWRNETFACCDTTQLNDMKTQLHKAEPLISSCPACKDNFFQLFCHFTCSANQSSFVDVTKTGTSMSGSPIVAEVEVLVDEVMATQFYDSCKNIKFGATNGYAMDLIGGGAQNYKQFLKFLGDEKPMLGGSPFQIDFITEQSKDLSPLSLPFHACDDQDENFRCACADCPGSCPSLPEMKRSDNCKVGVLPCFSFTVILIYSLALATYIGLYLLAVSKTRSRLLFLDSLESPAFSGSENELLNESDDQFENFEQYVAKDSYVVNNFLEERFAKLGLKCAKHPWIVIGLAVGLSILLASFTFLLELETNPVNLWVSPTSDTYLERKTFDESFGPFYRTQQLFISNATGDSILQDFDFIEWWFQKESEITSMQATYENSSVSYYDICFKPTGDECILESFTQYFFGDINQINREAWKSQLENCANSPVNCLPTFGQPLKPQLIFGGFNDSVTSAEAIVVTWLLNNNNDLDDIQVQKSIAWESLLEQRLLNLTQEASELGLEVSFSTEISLEKELSKSTNSDVRIVIISYLVMFAYASIALGSGSLSNQNNVKSNSPLSFLIHTRFGLGLVGILIVLLSVAASAGFWSIFGLKSTLIIAEVIPFLVLAIGVDNIFLISNELDNCNHLNYNNDGIEVRISRTLAKIGPSILLSTSCQFICFLLASSVGMPAVKNFALYCALAVLLNSALQMTAFVSAISLDQKRIEDLRLDCLPFIKLDGSYQEVSLPEDNQENEEGLSQLLEYSNENIFNKIVHNYYSPFLFRPNVSKWAFGFFVILFGVSLSLLPTIELGFDQRIAIPSDSYLIDYFNSVYDYLEVGPPIYMVVSSLDVTKLENQQKLCGRFTTCDEFSLVNIMEQEYKREEYSTINEPVSSWIDDFLLYLNPDSTDCCRLKRTNESEFCTPNQPSRQCKGCYEDKLWTFKMEGFPENETFTKYFDHWIESPSDPCPLGGKAPYSSSILQNEEGEIVRSAFRTSHNPLRSQKDFIEAYHQSLRVVKEIKKYLDLDVFAYSPFYIFFTQYETIVSLTFRLLISALILIYVISSLMLGSLKNSFLLVVNVVSILVNIGGAMALGGISLNAVSLVNVLICLGLSVEFSIHLIKAFNYNEDDAKTDSFSRAHSALNFIGGPTLSGITLTKLIGIVVLGFTRSKIFQIYYFRMWFALIILASLHSLVLLPLLLSKFGGKGYQVSQFANSNSLEVMRRLREDENIH
ncbi:hypothetical protein OGAPHI_001765 [Ogataea philodendri]|uniref:SSD domain-containing protein n=1 Tax=Ogataea philodendri TaxID=1378263 RepID=A0A9P8T6N7_9ASCO|nr:uncharacterized protein OGAPHI_001765 [Ogataea philodendri]KAH3668011.1 hypothetical protein OGAPHI_001765 [Ogataea philodendri]